MIFIASLKLPSELSKMCNKALFVMLPFSNQTILLTDIARSLREIGRKHNF